MEHCWFLVEARILAQECEFDKTYVEDSTDSVKNARDVPAGEKCHKLPLRYDKVVGESFHKVVGDNYEQRPTYIA